MEENNGKKLEYCKRGREYQVDVGHVEASTWKPSCESHYVKAIMGKPSCESPTV
jgi:hypothetical protein